MIKATITALKSAGKSVYMLYTSADDVDWSSIISDPSCLDGHITPMISYLKESKIDGVILGLFELLVSNILCYKIIIMCIYTSQNNSREQIKISLVKKKNRTNDYLNSLITYIF